MDAIQYERWLDFAQRMALKGWPHLTDARKQKIHDAVTDFIGYYRNCHEGIEGWDQGTIYICDDFTEAFEQHKNWNNEAARNNYYTQLSCCIRAAIDVAMDECAGVLGFDIGDVRRMYDGNLPIWFLEAYEEPDQVLAAADNTAIWL